MTTSWAEFLQTLLSPSFDGFMYVITNLSSKAFYGAALGFAYWIWDKRRGYKLSMVLFSSMLVNNFLKTFFAIPRPTASGNLRVIHPQTGGGFSFPSGHTQGAATFWGWVSYESQKKGLYFLTAAIIFMVAVSRIYLNVHWPMDVIGGIFIALGWIYLCRALFNRLGKIELHAKLKSAFAAMALITFYLIHPKGDSALLAGLLLGLTLGKYLDENYLEWNEKAAVKTQLTKGVVGILGFAVIRYGLKAVFNFVRPDAAVLDMVRYALVALWMSFGAPFLFVKFGWQLSGTVET